MRSRPDRLSRFGAVRWQRQRRTPGYTEALAKVAEDLALLRSFATELVERDHTDAFDNLAFAVEVLVHGAMRDIMAQYEQHGMPLGEGVDAARRWWLSRI